MKKVLHNRVLMGLVILAIGVFVGRMISPGNTVDNQHEGHGHETVAEVWTCSMHPNVRKDEPGKCPICAMDLVPVSTMTEEVGIDEVQMTEAAIQLANIQTTLVSSGAMSGNLSIQGVIKANERSLASVTAHFDGRVETLYADYTGQFIRKGQKLATIYSPDLVTAQKELFEAVRFKDSNPEYYKSAMRKLKLWELTDAQIAYIMEKGEPQFYFDVFAPRSGTILHKHISEGGHVKDGMVMFDIADLTKVWVVFDLYERQLPQIAVGDKVKIKTAALTGETLEASIIFIEPTVNAMTRTAAARAELSNKGGRLKPEMFVQGTLISEPRGNSSKSLLIPKTSVLWTGKRAIVYVKQPGYSQPTFQFREIELGPESGGNYIVLSGLSEGDEIVSNGVFKVDASAQLLGKVSMMNPFGAGGTKQFIEGEEKASPSIPQMGDVNQDFKNQLAAVFSAYLPVKDALIQTDSVTSADKARHLQTVLAGVDMTLITGQAHDQWMSYLQVLRSSIDSIIEAQTVEGQRQAFSPLSDTLYQSLVAYGVEGLGAYRQYCPMAFDFKGAFWLSDSDQVLNPYFGDVMLRCGSVEEELN